MNDEYGNPSGLPEPDLSIANDDQHTEPKKGIPRGIRNGIILGVIIIGIIVWGVVSTNSAKDSFAADYMPSSATNTCPTHYKCGASTIDQVQLENSLAARLRETEKNSETPNFGYDQVFIPPVESEPSDAMKKRADCAKDGAFPWEGMAAPYDDFELGMMDTNTSRNKIYASMGRNKQIRIILSPELSI